MSSVLSTQSPALSFLMPRCLIEENPMADDKDLGRLRQAKQAWERQTLQKTLERLPERQPQFTTVNGIAREHVYTPLDVANLDYQTALGFPGEYPFTRGVQPSMYRGRFWTMRQYAGF